MDYSSIKVLFVVALFMFSCLLVTELALQAQENHQRANFIQQNAK